MNSKVRFYTHALRACRIISPKRGSAPNTRSIDFIRRYIERVASRKRKIAVRVNGGVAGVAGERNVVGVPKFHSWDRCTMPLANINSDWMSNASFGF